MQASVSREMKSTVDRDVNLVIVERNGGDVPFA